MVHWNIFLPRQDKKPKTYWFQLGTWHWNTPYSWGIGTLTCVQEWENKRSQSESECFSEFPILPILFLLKSGRKTFEKDTHGTEVVESKSCSVSHSWENWAFRIEKKKNHCFAITYLIFYLHGSSDLRAATKFPSHSVI